MVDSHAELARTPEVEATGLRGSWVLALLTVGLSTAVLFWPLVLGALMGEPRFFEWDVPEQYWPDLVYLCDALHEGVLPFWNPYDRAGYPYYADPQAGMYHPLNWAICSVAGPQPGPGWAQARVVLGFFLAGVFALMWLRRLKVPWSGAILGAVAIQAAPFMRHNWELNLTLALAWLPLMLWAADRAVVERRLRDGVVLGLSVGFCAWVGSPPALWLACTFTLLYGLARFAGELRRHGRSVWRTVVPTAATAVVVSVGLLGAVLVPGLTLASYSVQSDQTFESIAEGALHASDLAALVWPRAGNHLYLGWTVLALGVVGAIRARRSNSNGVFLALAAFAAVLLSLGGNGPLFRLAYELIPGVSLFRLPHRYEAWLGPALGALAALGLAELASWRPHGPTRKRIRRAAVAALALATVSAVFRVWTPACFLLGLSAIALACLRTDRFGAGSAALGVALGLLLITDVSQSLPTNRHTRAGTHPGGSEVAARVLANAPLANYRYMDEFGVSCRSGTRLGRRDMRGYQDPLILKAYERVVDSLRETPELLAQFNVRYALQGPHFIHGWNRHYLPPPDQLASLPGAIVRGEGVIELANALPLAYFVAQGTVERAPDRPAALRRVRELAPAAICVLDGAVDPRQATHDVSVDPSQASNEDVVDRRPVTTAVALAAGPEGMPAGPIAASDLEQGRDTLSFVIEAASEGMVVMNEAWYPGWHAQVDGRDVPVHRANGLVRALALSEGTHTVSMRFEPADGVLWRRILLATWGGVILVLLLTWLRSRMARAERAR